MKIKLLKEADRFAAEQLAGLQNSRSLTALFAALIEARCPEEEDFEAVISKSLLPPSYRSNPSALGLQVLASVQGSDAGFADSCGYQTPGRHTLVTIKILREAKPAHQRYTHAKPSVKRLITEWLALVTDPSEPSDPLEFEHEDIPPFFFSHPEQLAFQIKRETQIAIKITRTATKWIITRK